MAHQLVLLPYHRLRLDSRLALCHMNFHGQATPLLTTQVAAYSMASKVRSRTWTNLLLIKWSSSSMGDTWPWIQLSRSSRSPIRATPCMTCEAIISRFNLYIPGCKNSNLQRPKELLDFSCAVVIRVQQSPFQIDYSSLWREVKHNAFIFKWKFAQPSSRSGSRMSCSSVRENKRFACFICN